MKIHPYPYEIPKVENFDPKQAKKNIARVLEFFRIEALLRSREVMELYEGWPPGTEDYVIFYNEGEDMHEGQFEPGEDALSFTYSIPYGWDVLKGAHHELIQREPQNPTMSLKEVKWEHRRAPHTIPLHLFSGIDDSSIEKAIVGSNDRYLFLRIDRTFPATIVLKELAKLLGEKGKWPAQATPIGTIQTWLNYFKCYDLHFSQGLSYGRVAKQVYPPGDETGETKKQDLVKKACRRVKGMIKAAEQGLYKRSWPPTSKSLNK